MLEDTGMGACVQDDDDSSKTFGYLWCSTEHSVFSPKHFGVVTLSFWQTVHRCVEWLFPTKVCYLQLLRVLFLKLQSKHLPPCLVA
jgi:hypothetical protein